MRNLRNCLKRMKLWIFFIGFFMKELIVSNIRVARDVLRVQPKFQSAIVAIPIDLESPFAIMVLANTITLTPGTLSVDYRASEKTLYIHSLYVDNGKEQIVNSIKNDFERRVAELFQC